MAERTYDSYERWSLDLGRAERDLAPGQLLRLQRQLAFLTLGAAVELPPGSGKYVRLSGVVLLTPVDSGRARASWNVSIGRPDTSVPPEGRASYSPAGPMEAGARLARLGPHQVVWITSSLPYIKVLEYGLYPSPVARGSWDPRSRTYVVRSAGGYSKQAPRGMVRVTYAAVRAALRIG